MSIENEVVDVIVLRDGYNPGFHAYMPYSEAIAIQNEGGLSGAKQVNLRETPDRPIPESVKNGTTCITDILVELQPKISFSLN